MKSRLSAVNVIIRFLLVLMFVAICSCAIYVIKSKTAAVSDFSLNLNGETITQSKSVKLTSGDKILVNSPHDYTVAVYGYYVKGNDFDYTVNGGYYRWSLNTKTDFVSFGGFTVKKDADGFIISFGNFEEIVGNGEPIICDKGINGDCFRLAVSSNGNTISLFFSPLIACETLSIPAEMEF